MIGASKILTVSYGTFSCTLEGFDDPFNTMKAIAEYFRDLAAGDRYFGAEPPTPDAAMLHKIAEREIQRRVEARVQENGVILRAADSGPAQIEPPPPLMPRTLAPAMPEDTALSARLDRIRSAVAQAAPAAAPRFDMQQAQDLLPENGPPASTADSLPEDLAPQADDAEPMAQDQAAPMEAAVTAEADFGAELMPGWAEPAETLAAAEAAPAVEDAVAQAPVADFPAEIHDGPATEPGFVAEPAASPGPQPDRVRARVIRIRRAPALPAETVEALPPLSAAPEAAAFVTEVASSSLSDEDEADLLRELAALETEDFAQTANSGLANSDLAQPAAVTGFEDDLAALDLSALDIVAEEPAVIAADDSETTFVEDTFEALAPLGQLPQDFGADDRAAQETEPALVQPDPGMEDAVYEEIVDIEDFADLADAGEEDLYTAAAVAADADMDAFDAEAEAALDAALNAPEVPETADLPATEAPTAAAPVRPARPTRPVRRLSVARSPQPEAAADAGRARDRLPATVDPVNEEEAVARLLAETNSQMAGPDSRRRVSAIAHLKAAVAATVADRRAGSSLRKTEEERVEPYREDLSRIVRPAQAAGGARPAPLVLVSELRVDPQPQVTPSRPRLAEPVAQAAAPGPVRPRRVGSAALAPQDMIDEDEDDIADPLAPEEARGFAEFADRLGAIGLPALLEAAAAYTACVEGRPHFSRPQLMRQVTTMAEDHGHSREDSLRSFGTLLREGRIVKVRRGQYALAEESHLLAKARRLVG